MLEHIDIVLGCRFGDEDKRKVVFHLLHNNNYNLCVRFNGFGNTGYTINKNKQKIRINQLPDGILVPNMYNLISSDCLIDINLLTIEINELKLNGIDITGRLFISKSCHIITPNTVACKETIPFETTGADIENTFVNKILRTGKRVEDYFDVITSLGVQIVDMRKFWFSTFFQNNIKNMLLIGSQGFELDINWTNNYPLCTYSTCSLGCAINTGIPLNKIRHIYGITKAYDTYVGNLDFQPPLFNELLNKIADIGNEYSSTTGKRRQLNFLNLDDLIESLKINNCNICIINKADILTQTNIYKLYYNNILFSFNSILDFQFFICNKLDFLTNKPIFM